MVTQDQVDALKEAIAFYPTQAEFGRVLAFQTNKPVTSSHMAQWLHRSPVPVDIAIAIELMTGVVVERFRPDIPLDEIIKHRLMNAPIVAKTTLALAEQS